ncbi:MAG: hypothetical protein HUU32_09225 [Calditrichaceae bacterium]|nr:cell wall-active antibiotics response protein [Calditrichia bacterium]NUQ41560.1 hypothetical protein [Calditrichaceae bacterium]
MNESKPKFGANFWLSIGLILLGLYLLLENLGFIYWGDIWDYWPLILVIIGLVKLYSSNFREVYSASVWIAVGLLLFLVTRDYIDLGDIFQFWPVILILIGIRIVWTHYLRSNRPDRAEESFTQDRIDAVAIFGGREVQIASENFEGGNITAIFGGVEIDFSGSRLAPGNNILDVFVMFGGAELRVPRNWNVVMKGMPIFGGFEDARRQVMGEELAPENLLIIKGLVLFGGLEVKDAG